MPSFHYQARNADGQVVTGNLDADGVQQAVAQLQSRGLTVQSIGFAEPGSPSFSPDVPIPDSRAADSPAPPRRRSPGESVEQAVLRAHMNVILERGRSIAPALRAYAEEMPAGWQRRRLLDVCRLLERGNPSEVTAALADVPDYWIPLLSAATSSPDPGLVLREFLNESRRTDDLRQKWWLTLAYPLFLIGLAAVVLTALSIFIIPQFREMFDEFGLQLGWLTEWVLQVAMFLARWGIPLIVVVVAIFTLLILNANHLLPSWTVGWLANRFRPLFGRRTAVARFARFTADLLEAGVSVPDALRIAGFTANQMHMQRAAWQLANELEATGTFSERDYQNPLTATVVFALAPDTPPTSRVRLLREISSSHGERVRRGLSWTTGIVEPIAICVVGIAVGITVLALFMPLVKLVEGLSK